MGRVDSEGAGSGSVVFGVWGCGGAASDGGVFVGVFGEAQQPEAEVRLFVCPTCGARIEVRCAVEVGHRCRKNRNRWTEWEEQTDE